MRQIAESRNGFDDQRAEKFNYALQPMPFEQFRDLVTSEQSEVPGYFIYDAIKNRQERPGLESTRLGV